MEFSFVACSQRVGTIKEIGPVTQQQLIITSQGSWIPQEDADVIVEREYPVWCPAKRQFTLQPNVVYETQPSAQQLKLKPI